ncbi:hypothetical protein SAMD00023353_3000420 [Rosellinia necatrix]|uniref:Fungal N-terminal domain-containing protein n=1 Tax=Rosellinia necatrix TaxID=77044 RepID=A0A1W2TJ64_ROSNE|nr:hypothetical protein SAMD00023353_3000420 [Rosellinia necatrix]
MAFQVSIGDGILIAQIAWRLARTFTKGRQSAPAEFQELENELYALSAALRAAEAEQNNLPSSTKQVGVENDQYTATQDILAHVIGNCKNILGHLEEIVNKYTVVSERGGPGKRKLKKWSESAVRNWKKIEWTTERGDLDTLRSQIAVHINSLNLLVNIGTSSRTASIERSLDKKLALLEELHQWYVINLKETVPTRSTTSDRSTRTSEQAIHAQPPSIISTFELAKKRETSVEIICSCASFRAEWMESFLDDALNAGSGCMFTCCCLRGRVGLPPHQAAVQRYGLSHLIFPIRIASGDRPWMLYKVADGANNQLVDLYVSKIHPSYIRSFEDTFLRTLSSRRAGAILTQGVGNSLCYISPEDGEGHILEAMSNLTIAQKSVESIMFKSGRTQHVREWIDDVQILQYGVQGTASPADGIQTGLVRHLDYSEVLVSFGADDAASDAEEDSDVVSMILKLKRNTVTKLTEKACVDIMSIEAVGTHTDERTTTHTGVDVTIQFTTKAAAKEFHENIEAMRTELFVRSLRYPRSNERIVLNLQTARVECEHLYIDDAEIIIVVDADAKYRLIIASRNGCTIMSQVLVEDFFAAPSGRPDYTGSTYLVQIEDTGERKVYHYKNGFRHLSLSTTQANRMLELARSSVSFKIQNGE